VLEACRGSEHQHPGRLHVNDEGVRDPPRRERETARGRLQHRVADVERHLPVEDVPGLILPVMDMQRRLGRLEGHRLHQRETLLGHSRGGLGGEPAAQ
jgi:hypothetical protein